MRFVINGKTYNTHTATKICDLWCGSSPGNPHYHESALYRTKKGAYFIAGTGGPGTIYGDGVRGGRGLRVVSAHEARFRAAMDAQEKLNPEVIRAIK